ncbi:hypothetical protein ACWGR3_28810 [Streptomyces albidoflavus]
MTRIDHAAEAKRLAGIVVESDDPKVVTLQVVANTIGAQVHATLALVEQQRIANLIALSQGTFPNGQRYTDRIHYPLDEYSVAMNEDIREALGL